MVALIALYRKQTEQPAAADVLEPFQSKVLFTIVVPQYLPAGTMRAPQATISNGTLDFYYPVDSANAPDAQRAFVRIVESPQRELPTSFLKLPPQPHVQKTSIAGHEIQLVTYAGPAVQVIVQIIGDVSGTHVVEQVNWAAPTSHSQIQLTEEMKQQAFDIFESMIDARSPT